MTSVFRWTIGLVLVLSGMSAQAAATCFEDVRSWEAVKNQLPHFMRTDDLYATHSSGSLKGGFKIIQTGREFYLEIHMKHFLGRYDDEARLARICVDAPVITVTYQNGKERIIDMEADGGLKVKGKVFYVTDRAAYDDMMNRIGR
ncbi:MAG TPA: hypothetical protein VM432_12285 [Bdellovibrionales bacterium]|nr:hypothetical protein [Bdellovibrionales bacterium]